MKYQNFHLAVASPSVCIITPSNYTATFCFFHSRVENVLCLPWLPMSLCAVYKGREIKWAFVLGDCGGFVWLLEGLSPRTDGVPRPGFPSFSCHLDAGGLEDAVLPTHNFWLVWALLCVLWGHFGKLCCSRHQSQTHERFPPPRHGRLHSGDEWMIGSCVVSRAGLCSTSFCPECGLSQWKKKRQQ